MAEDYALLHIIIITIMTIIILVLADPLQNK